MEFTTVIGKAVLLERLRENKVRYVATRKTLIKAYKKKDDEYKKAYREYSKKVVNSTLSDTERRPQPPSIPEDRTYTYTTYIEMIDRHCDETLVIDIDNFSKLFMDKWDFIRHHINALTVWADSDASLASAVADYGGE